MNYGWVDPDSITVDATGGTVIADFFMAADGRRLELQVPARDALRLDSLLAAQAQHGIVHLRTDLPELNSAETVRGTVLAENRTSGMAKLQDGREMTAEFPQGTFDNPGHFMFRGTGAVENGVLDVFAADTIASDAPAHSPYP